MIRVVLVVCGAAALAGAVWGAEQVSKPSACCQTSKQIVSPSLIETSDATCDQASCTLSAEDQADRVAVFDRQLRPHVRETRELAGGYALRFDSSQEIILSLADWIAEESRCCAFLDYQLTVQKAGGPVWLQMTGDEAAKRFLQPLLVAEGEAAASD